MEIAIAIISGVLTFAGTVTAAVLSARQTRDTVTKKLEVAQAVTDTKIDELTREVREHNNFARRMPVVEEQIKVANHRIEDLERKVENA